MAALKIKELFFTLIVISILNFPASAEIITEDEFIHHLREVLVRNNSVPVIVRWHSHIYYDVNENLFDDIFVKRKIQLQHFKLKKYIPIQIYKTSNINNVNVLIYTYGEKPNELKLGEFLRQYRKLSDEDFVQSAVETFNRGASCNLKLEVSKSEIRRAVIFINNKLSSGDKVNCYVKNLMNVLGVFGNSNNKHSATSKYYYKRSISTIDYMTLRFLYDSRIATSTPTAEAVDFIESLIDAATPSN